jgi:hypothetical protein
MGINIEKTFDASAIRDTNSHDGATVYNGEFSVKTIIVENGLNQQVTLQCQASANADFSHAFDIGNEWIVNASTDTYQTCDSFFPYSRIVATCGTSPTTGSLTAYIIGVG